MTLWLIDRNQAHYRLTDSFTPAFFVSGSEEGLAHLQDAAQKQATKLRVRLTERTDLWRNAQRKVLEASVLAPTEFGGWGRWVHRVDSRLQMYNSALMVASLYCWAKRVLPLGLEVVARAEEGRSQASEWRAA